MRCWPTSKALSVLNMAHAGQFDRRSTASFRSCAERIDERSSIGRVITHQQRSLRSSAPNLAETGGFICDLDAAFRAHASLHPACAAGVSRLAAESGSDACCGLFASRSSFPMWPSRFVRR